MADVSLAPGFDAAGDIEMLFVGLDSQVREGSEEARGSVAAGLYTREQVFFVRPTGAVFVLDGDGLAPVSSLPVGARSLGLCPASLLLHVAAGLGGSRPPALAGLSPGAVALLDQLALHGGSDDEVDAEELAELRGAGLVQAQAGDLSLTPAARESLSALSRELCGRAWATARPAGLYAHEGELFLVRPDESVHAIQASAVVEIGRLGLAAAAARVEPARLAPSRLLVIARRLQVPVPAGLAELDPAALELLDEMCQGDGAGGDAEVLLARAWLGLLDQVSLQICGRRYSREDVP